MKGTKTKAEVLAGVQESVGSIFTKEDVVTIINSIKEEEGGTISKDKLVDILSEIDFDSYIEKEITIDSGDLNFSFDTSERGNGITITAEVDESTVEDAVTVEISSVDVHGLADEILSGLED
jgi:hypothetical protein